MVAARQNGCMELDIHADHTWDDVLSMQRGLAEERETQTSKGVKGFAFKHLRRFGDNSKAFQSWLKLLPTESHYLSVLCGGLQLILGVGT